jgi:hypothetical protein
VLAAEHLLRLAGVDLRGQIVQRATEIVGNRLPRLCPFDEHREVVHTPLQTFVQVAVFLEAAPALQQLLSRGLVLPEVRLGDAFFDFQQFDFGLGGVKDSSAGRWRGAPGLRACEAVRPVEGP